MSFFIATVGELVIVELCVLWIWLRVLFDAVSNRQSTVDYKKLLMTSFGLVLNSIAITGIMVFRLIEFVTNFWPFVSGIVAFYVMLAVGNIMFIFSASIGTRGKILKVFFGLTAGWTILCLVLAFGKGIIYGA